MELDTYDMDAHKAQEQDTNTKTVPVSEVYAVCEDIEDEAEQERAKAQSEIAFAYQNGRRHAAKSIRRAIGAIT